MEATNNYGRKVYCTICNKYELKGYKVYTPPFANAIDSVYIGWCAEHEQEGLKRYNDDVNGVDRINQASSNS